MKRENNPLILCLFGILPVVWLGLLIAPAAHGGLPEIVARFPAVMNDPFHIEFCGDSLKTVLILLCAYGLTVSVILSSRHNYRQGEEHGSAKWGSARTVNRKYRATAPEANKIFTQNVRMGLDGRKHRRNLNTVVVGGSGAGKTRFYAKPNLCQANTSFTVLDPKGELLRSTGHLLWQKGYEVRVLDLLNMEKSYCYNPFVYLRDDNDVQRLVTNLFKSTTPKGSQSNDPFWDTAASMLLLALIFYLKYEAPPDEQNFPMVMEMLRAADVREDCDEYITVAVDMGESARLRIIGTVTNGPSNEIYCPYFMSWSEGVSVAFLTDSCSFDIRNNQKLEESKSYIYEWFVRPDLSNQMDGLTFGVLIHDETYQKNIEEIQANLSMLHLLLPVLIIVCGGIGFFASFLATRGRTKEFAVMRCLGMKQCKIFGLVMGELSILAFTGAFFGIAGGILLEGEIQTSALLHAALMTGIFLLGSAVAALRITSINVMNLMKVED